MRRVKIHIDSLEIEKWIIFWLVASIISLSIMYQLF